MHKVADLAKWSPVIERSSGDVSSMSDKASLKSGIQARRARRNYDYEAKRVRESSASDPKRPRRQNACNPCKARRTRVRQAIRFTRYEVIDSSQCDGAKPCGSCCRAGKTGKQPCEYTQKVQDKLRDPTTRQDQSAAHKTLHAKRVSLRRTIDEVCALLCRQTVQNIILIPVLVCQRLFAKGPCWTTNTAHTWTLVGLAYAQ